MPRHVTSQTVVHPATKPGYSIAGELVEDTVHACGARLTLVLDDLLKVPVRDRHVWARGVLP